MYTRTGRCICWYHFFSFLICKRKLTLLGDIFSRGFVYCMIFVCRAQIVIEFYRNTQSWQCWHFCTTSNVNKLETVKDLVHFKVNYTCLDATNFNWCGEFLYLSHFSNLGKYKNANFANFVYYGKTRMQCQSGFDSKTERVPYPRAPMFSLSWIVFFFCLAEEGDDWPNDRGEGCPAVCSSHLRHPGSATDVGLKFYPHAGTHTEAHANTYTQTEGQCC